jgi:hypothetical protein
VKFSRQHTRHSWPGVVFCGLLFFLCLAAVAETPKPKTTVTIDLPKQSRDNSLRGPNGIEYIDGNSLAIWYTEKSEGQLSRRDKLEKSDPWQLTLDLVNLSDGSVKQRQEWPTRKNSSSLAVQREGRAVLLTGPLVHCFSPEFRETRSFTLKDANQPKEQRLLRASPGGTVVWEVEAAELATATRIDPDSCTAGLRFDEPRSAPTLSGNDYQLVDINATQAGVWAPDLGWRLLYKHQCCLTHSLFLAPDLVGIVSVAMGTDRHFLLINLSGELLLDDTLEPGMEFNRMVTSADGKTAAVIVAERAMADTQTGIETVRTHAKVRFYDLVKHKKMMTVDVNVPGENLFGVAIAPDSSQFALLNGSKLSLYALRP